MEVTVLLGLYGILRFYTTLQPLTNRSLYDIESGEFILKDEPILTSQITPSKCCSLSSAGDDAMQNCYIILFASSVALKLSLQS